MSEYFDTLDDYVIEEMCRTLAVQQDYELSII